MIHSQYNEFIFENYVFNRAKKNLKLYYSLYNSQSHKSINFLEEYVFDFEFADYDNVMLDKALQALFLMAGISYYKVAVPKNLIIKKGSLDSQQANFFNRTWQKGLGEFWYVNKLDPSTIITFPITAKKQLTNYAVQSVQKQTDDSSSILIGLGGGKDSLVTIEALRNSGLDIATWSLNHRLQLEPQVQKIALKHMFVERTLDYKLIELNLKPDTLNGHIPISAIFATVGTMVAILSGRQHIVMSNEHSANEPTLKYHNVAINHQYSKSEEFEIEYQKFINYLFQDAIQYYSFLRPLSELYIAEIFAKTSFDKYKDVFSSCNRAFILSSNKLFWCGQCSKCAFIFMILTPFIEKKRLLEIWNGKNLLEDPSLTSTYQQLLGLSGNKPLDCVGQIAESRQAMQLCQAVYPELRLKYKFNIDYNYKYQQLQSHQMPPNIFNNLKSFLNIINSHTSSSNNIIK